MLKVMICTIIFSDVESRQYYNDDNETTIIKDTASSPQLTVINYISKM